MELGALIVVLNRVPREQKVVKGFNNPHSYRGYYDELAFEPCDDTTVGEMLDCANEALGTTYEGWKGGDYLMTNTSTVNLSYEGSSGDSMSLTLVEYMIGIL